MNALGWDFGYTSSVEFHEAYQLWESIMAGYYALPFAFSAYRVEHRNASGFATSFSFQLV